MKYSFYILFILTCWANGQSVDVSSIKSTVIDVESLVSIDNFGVNYFVKNNVFYKKTRTDTTTYNNLQLGELESANTFNPLKINLFYKDFNTAVILDNRLAEIFKINFNNIQPYKNVSHISTGYDNTLWLFNTDLRYLELYDYKSNIVRAQTMPVQSEVLDIESNYNFCWLLTKNFLYKYNYFGSLISKVKNDGFQAISENDGNIILKRKNQLYYLKKNSSDILPLKTPNLLINDFFVVNETLYIYDSKNLHEYSLKTN